MRRRFPRTGGRLSMALLVTVGAALIGCGAEAETDAPPATELPRIDLEGLREMVNETAAEDRVLVIDFWATWCGPCTAMFGDLHDGLIALGDDVRPVSVTLDAPDVEPQAIGFLKQHHAMHDAYMLMPDSDAQLEVAMHFGEQWQDLGLPAILVFDQQGELSAEFLQGGKEAVPGIVQHVESLLNSPATAQANPQPSSDQGQDRVDAEDG